MIQLSLITQSDIEDFLSAEKRILDLLKDHNWHSASEIIEVGQQREALRRLRNLRSKGYEIEKTKAKGREFAYRLIERRQLAEWS